MTDRYAELRARLAQVDDLRQTANMLAWDQRTLMPQRGAGVRAERIGTLRRIAHERFVDSVVGELLAKLAERERELDYGSDEASLIRVARRDYERDVRIPAELVGELARASSRGHEAWVEARRRSDFSLFLPYLERNIGLQRSLIDCLPAGEHPYDVLLDFYEPGMTTAELRRLFGPLRSGLAPLIEIATANQGAADASFLEGPFSHNEQERFATALVEELGFNSDSWRLDESEHPFSAGFGTGDIRITTRYRPQGMESFFSVVHEFGHGLYDRQVSPTLDRTPIYDGVSLGLHESQSRLWENVIARSRPFWQRHIQQLCDAFPGQLAGLEPDDVYRAVNRVAPSLIRVEADEVTYNLHIIMRFELEVAIFEDRVEPRDLPAAWRERSVELLGLAPADDAEGVLQDVHWSQGTFGYFPTYALGNIIGAQLWQRLVTDLPDIDVVIERGDYGLIRDWLREHIHRHGRKFTTAELLQRITGGGIDIEPLLAYLDAKVKDVYGVQ